MDGRRVDREAAERIGRNTFMARRLLETFGVVA